MWYAHMRGTLTRDGFVPNGYVPYIFNKIGADGAQITVAMHVDDLFVVNMSDDNLEKFEHYMRNVYSQIMIIKGRVLGCLGMAFDFVEPGQVSIYG